MSHGCLIELPGNKTAIKGTIVRRISQDLSPQSAAENVDLFVRETINPWLLEKSDSTNYGDCWKDCGKFGLLGTHISTQYGGCGTDVSTAVRAMESLGYSCIDNGFAFAINVSLFSDASLLDQFANQEQKDKYLKPLCHGDLKCAYALTEERAGSDAYALSTQAQQVKDGYLLTGTKMYITLAPVADFAVVFATSDVSRGRWGITAFLVDLSGDGIKTTAMSKAGLKRVPMGTIEFTDCFVPNENILGKLNAGAAVFEESQIWERSFVLASHVGTMQRQLDSAIEHVKTRKQFAQAIGQFQSVSNRIADMRLHLETARLMLYHVARLKDAGTSIRLESTLAKLHISECFHANSLDAIRIHAASGYTNDALAMSDLDDSVASLLIGGTNDIQRNIISRYLNI